MRFIECLKHEMLTHGEICLLCFTMVPFFLLFFVNRSNAVVKKDQKVELTPAGFKFAEQIVGKSLFDLTDPVTDSNIFSTFMQFVFLIFMGAPHPVGILYYQRCES